MMRSSIQYLLVLYTLLAGVYMQGLSRVQQETASFVQELPSQEFSTDRSEARMLQVHPEIKGIVEILDLEPVVIQEEVEEENEKWNQALAQLNQQSHQVALFISLLARTLDGMHERMYAHGYTDLLAASRARCLTYCLLRI